MFILQNSEKSLMFDNRKKYDNQNPVYFALYNSTADSCLFCRELTFGENERDFEDVYYTVETDKGEQAMNPCLVLSNLHGLALADAAVESLIKGLSMLDLLPNDENGETHK